LRGHSLAIEGLERFQQVVVNDVAFQLLLGHISRAEGVGVLEVEVDLTKEGCTWMARVQPNTTC
jgi:hypothetical protein